MAEVCVKCGAPVKPGHGSCWQCFANLKAPGAIVEGTVARPEIPVARPAPAPLPVAPEQPEPGPPPEPVFTAPADGELPPEVAERPLTMPVRPAEAHEGIATQPLTTPSVEDPEVRPLTMPSEPVVAQALDGQVARPTYPSHPGPVVPPPAYPVTPGPPSGRYAGPAPAPTSLVDDARDATAGPASRFVARCGIFWGIIPWLPWAVWLVQFGVFRHHPRLELAGILLSLAALLFFPVWVVLDIMDQEAPWWWLLIIFFVPFGFFIYYFAARD